MLLLLLLQLLLHLLRFLRYDLGPRRDRTQSPLCHQIEPRGWTMYLSLRRPLRLSVEVLLSSATETVAATRGGTPRLATFLRGQAAHASLFQEPVSAGLAAAAAAAAAHRRRACRSVHLCTHAIVRVQPKPEIGNVTAAPRLSRFGTVRGRTRRYGSSASQSRSD